MGKPRYIYFTDINDEKLQKVHNKSGLINGLLEEHFKKDDIEQMTPQELRKAIKIEKLKKSMEAKIKELENA